MDLVSHVHSAGPQSQFDDHGSPLDDIKSLWAEPPTPPPATLIESSSAGDLTPYCDPVAVLPLPSLPAQDSSPMGELLESCSDEAVSDVRAPLIIDASPCPASSTGTSSHDLANELSLLHVQDSGSPPDKGSHQQQSVATFQSSGYGSPSHNGNTSQQQLHPRGRRGPSRGNRPWNVRHTGFSGRNNRHMPPRGVPRPLPRPLHPFSPHLPPFAPLPWGPALAPSPLWPPGPGPHYRPHVPPHGNGNFPAILEFELRLKIVKQVEYYFSYTNLITDEYLRRRMDEQGWVPVRIIAGFRKIKELTDNIQIVFDALRTSAVLEILGDNVRSRFNWQGWSIPIDTPSYTVFREPTQT